MCVKDLKTITKESFKMSRLNEVKEELLREINYNKKTLEDIKWVKIRYGDGYNDLNLESRNTFILKEDWKPEDLAKFLSKLTFTYDSGYGGQELFGFVCFTDGSWLERGEYDGAEWWVYKKTPQFTDPIGG